MNLTVDSYQQEFVAAVRSNPFTPMRVESKWPCSRIIEAFGTHP